MAGPSYDDRIDINPRRIVPTLRPGLLLLMVASLSCTALAGEPASSPALAAGNAGSPGQSAPAPKGGASEPLAQELAGARREVELLQHLSQEHERAERLDQNLASVRRALDAQTALAIKARQEAAQNETTSAAAVADLTQAAQKERERAETVAAALTKVRLELNASQARATEAADEAAELRQRIESSAPVRQPSSGDANRIAVFERDLAAARREIDDRTTSLAKAGEEIARLRSVSEAANVSLKQAAQKEHERAEALAGELTRDLGIARRERDEQVALATKSRSDAERLRETSERDVTLLREQVRLERSKAESLERDLAVGVLRKDPPMKVSGKVTGTPGVAPSVQEAPLAAAPVVNSATVVEVAERPTPEMTAASIGLVARASSLLGQGDVVAARTVLERAATMGSAQASFALAETYDPLVLAKWDTFGTRGDPAMARDLYAKAVAGGIKEAKERVEALRR